MRKFLLPAFSLLALASCSRRERADLIVRNAVIYTMDSAGTVVQAMAVKDGKVLATGSNAFIEGKFGSDSVRDAQGAFIYPGFNDAHAHFAGYAAALRQVDLTGTESWQQVLERTKAFAAEHPSAWIQGRGWDQNDWTDKSFPDKTGLDSLFPTTPVMLVRVDGHAMMVNQAALDAAGLQPGVKSDGGGVIETRNGKLTGLLIDNAMHPVYTKVPPPTREALIASLVQAEKNCIAAGITSLTDCGLELEDMRLLDTLLQQKTLHLGLNLMLSDGEETVGWLVKNGPYRNGQLQVRSVKFYGDGALGSRGACLLHDYADKPGWKGFMRRDAAHFAAQAARLAPTQIQMCTHAIGDSANRAILRIYADALKGHNDKRWRIEHAQVVDSADFALFGQANVVPSVQPTHATSDMYWAGERLGAQRVKYAYAFKRLLKENGWLPLGTDFPVENIDPLLTFYAAVARKDAKGWPAGGFQLDDALNREEAMRGMTIWAARAAFEENIKGSLEPGKQADFVITDTDLIEAPEEKIRATKVLATYIYGVGF